MASILLFMLACQKDRIEPPVITGVLNYEASPNDTVVHTIREGQWVVLQGKNLSEVTHLYFGSIPATINSALYTDKSIVVQVPSIPFESVPTDDLNIITAINEAGITTFSINIVGTPILKRVRNFASSPNDTIVNLIEPGQKINIVGLNLKNATEIAFQGIAADLSNLAYTDTSAIVLVPNDLTGSDALLANTITYTTESGTGSFGIKIIGPPTITGISYEVPQEGDSVYIYGYNFISVQSLSFAGAPITSFEVSSDESTIGFVAPALTRRDPVVITTNSGTFTTAYNVNDVRTGIISDFEWGDYFLWDWWAGATLESEHPDFPGNPGQYLVLKTDILESGDGFDWTTAIRMSEARWLPAENLSDPVNSWALKFEISIPDPWNGGTLFIKSSTETYMYRYEPWKVSSSVSAPYSTNGWQTVTIPLSSFRENDSTLGKGKGELVTSLIDLVGTTGESNLILYMHNDSPSPTRTGFNAAFDNFRIVRR